jgi:glyceraldehyde 3-phosphate dehydrogenase
MTKKIAINGFGRIGRAAFKNIMDDYPEVELVAVNDLSDIETLGYLLSHDTVYGNYESSVDGDCLVVRGEKVKIFQEREPENLPWKELGVDVVLECTGVFRNLEGAKRHITAGAKRVIISAPSKEPEKISSYVLGVNEEKFDKSEEVVDMGSCTTNALAFIVDIIHKNFGIKEGLMTTVHSYTVTQNTLDASGQSELRRCRAAAENIVPTTTGAAKTISKVIPEMEGKLDGMAIRVPTPTVSLVDLTCTIEKEATEEDINNAFLEAEKTEKMKKYFATEKMPLVSSDYIKNPHSSIVDLELTKVVGKTVKVLAWYDNEWAYAKRLVDFASYICD